MPQDEKEGGFWSKADSYQPKTPAMKSWKEKYLEGNQSKHGEDEEKPRINNLDDYTNRQLQKENSWNGFIRPLKLFIPLSIISFYNESINGYFCMWGECAPPPPYYYFPRIIALIAVIFFFNMAWQERGESEYRGSGYAWGMFFGVIFGFLMFFVLSVMGWASDL
tara:strand:- start:299 stop:793 length:495 start_codon:yes stop_codon:yes gene_type:complete